MSKKNLSRITVSDIIEKADVGRATFYAHFETKDSLTEELCKELFCHVFDSTQAGNITHKHIFDCDVNESAFFHLLIHIRNNDNRILDLLSCENNELFLRYFKNGVVALVESQYAVFENRNKNLPREYAVNHIASSFVETVKWWLSNGLKQTPETVNDYFLSVIK